VPHLTPRPVALAVALALGLALAAGAPAARAASDPAELLRKVDAAANAFKDRKIDIEMTLIDTDGALKKRTLSVWEKGGSKRLVRFTSGDLKGMGVLVEDRHTMYVYLPGEDKVRRLGLHAATASFQGSDFTNDDMAVLKYTDDYDPKILKEEGGKATVELTPKKDAKVEWTRLVLTVDLTNFNADRCDYYDAKDPSKPAKTQTRTEPKTLAGRLTYTLVTMVNNRSGHKTELRILAMEGDTGLADDFFKPRTLMR